jgi:hypothetical protein
MAITADKIRRYRASANKVLETFAIATGQTVFIGSMVNFVGTTGRIRDAAAATGRTFAGVVEKIINDSGAAITTGTGNTAGTVKAKITWGVAMVLSVATAARTFTSLNKNVFVADNDTVTDTTGAGTSAVRVKVGALVEFVDSTKTSAWVELRRYASADAT